MTLAFEEYPNPGAPTLVLVHGFTQNARCWGDLPTRLQRRFRVLAVDAPGHGRTPAVHDRADPGEAARLIGEIGGHAGYLGYSMGGRLCLRLACDRPDLVEHLVLVGATPGLAGADERAARRAGDEALARGLEADGLEAFLDRWLALPLFAGLTEATAARDRRSTNRVAGLAASLRSCGTGSQDPLWSRLDALTMPVLAVAGADDHKFAAEAARLVDAIRTGVGARGGRADATAALVDGAGHTAHLERPAAFLELVSSWWTARAIATGPAAPAAPRGD